MVAARLCAVAITAATPNRQSYRKARKSRTTTSERTSALIAFALSSSPTRGPMISVRTTRGVFEPKLDFSPDSIAVATLLTSVAAEMFGARTVNSRLLPNCWISAFGNPAAATDERICATLGGCGNSS